jgi:ribosomal-protein-alanine N-acetyltransferase
VHELRLAGGADAAALALLHALSFPPAERWGGDAIRLLLEMPGTFGLQAEELGFILCRVAADEAEVLTLAVRPEARRLGLGAALLHSALELAAAAGAVRLFLEVSDRNEPAQRLYRSAGFTAIGRRRRYYADGSDALILSRSCQA